MPELYMDKMKQFNKFEQMPSAREHLLDLEKQGKYVFHGSIDENPELEPKQAHTLNKKTGEMEKDKEPAVFATPFADVAIFRALINEKRTAQNSSSSFGIDGDKFRFSAFKNLIDIARTAKGKVYVFEKELFGKVKGTECRSQKKVKPIEIIEVGFKDLPKKILIAEE